MPVLLVAALALYALAIVVILAMVRAAARGSRLQSALFAQEQARRHIEARTRADLAS